MASPFLHNEGESVLDGEPQRGSMSAIQRRASISKTSLPEIRAKCRRFRMLIMGKANAGKTTILQKICNSTEAPIVCNPSGEKVCGDMASDPAYGLATFVLF
jgi:tRNA U34 5-carboxymethylaminomethyl modifying GTPase MnmE/TrmE